MLFGFGRLVVVQLSIIECLLYVLTAHTPSRFQEPTPNFLLSKASSFPYPQLIGTLFVRTYEIAAFKQRLKSHFQNRLSMLNHRIYSCNMLLNWSFTLVFLFSICVFFVSRLLVALLYSAKLNFLQLFTNIHFLIKL